MPPAGAVATRDRAMLAAGARPEDALPKIAPPVLGPGLLHHAPDGQPVRPAGHIAAQGRVSTPDGRTGLLDELVGTGFRVAATADPRQCLSADRLAFLSSIDARLVRITPADQLGPEAARDEGVHTVGDIDSFLLPYLKEVDHAAVIVRPDFYLYGTAETLTQLPALVDELRADLAQPVP